MHVVQTIASLQRSKGGVSRSVIELSVALSRARDLRVSVVSADRGASADIAYLRARAPYAGLEIMDPGRTFTDVSNRARLDSSGRTIVHDNGLWLPSNLQAAAAARVRRVPLIISPHGMLENWALGHRRVRKRIALGTYQQWCLKSARAFHATSAQEALNVRRLGLRQPIAVLGNGVEPPPASFRLRPDRVRRALFLSRLHPKKGVLELIRAWGEVRPAGWRLRIVGPDEHGYRRHVAAAIFDAGLGPLVELCDAADEAQRWRHFEESELFVLPTYSENFGLVIGEALGCGLPVITTSATPWIGVTTRGCGWIIPPSESALAAALRTATGLSREALCSMGARGREWIPREFAWESISSRMRRFYVWVAEGCARSNCPDFVEIE